MPKVLEVPRRSYLGTPATAPGPTGPQMLAAMLRIRANPLAYLHQTWQAFGDIAQFPVPRPPSYLVTDPVAVRRVLVDRSREYTKDTLQYRALALVTGEGLLASLDPREHRRILQPAFHQQGLDPLAARVDQSARALVAQWQRLGSGAAVDVEAAMASLALQTVGHALFGQDLTRDAERIVEATLEGLDVVIARARTPISPPSWLPTPRNRQLARANGELDRAVRSLVSARSSDSQRAVDALDLLIQAHDSAGRPLTAKQIRDEIVTLIVAGHETVASAMTWCLALLAAHPEVQQRLHVEAAAVLTDDAVGMAQITQLPLARAVIDESMRLYPPAWLITRRAEADDVLAQALIPQGSLVIMSPYLVHRHPDHWPRPEQFDPDRFLSGPIDRNAFIPFGAGPRLCIGRDFAYAESVALLARLVRHLQFAFPPGGRFPGFEPGVTMRPAGGLSLQVTSRS